jgi:hypothetical protein
MISSAWSITCGGWFILFPAGKFQSPSLYREKLHERVLGRADGSAGPSGSNIVVFGFSGCDDKR